MRKYKLLFAGVGPPCLGDDKILNVCDEYGHPGRRFGVHFVYTLAGESGTGSHPLALPSIDVSRQSTRLEKTMRLKASKKGNLTWSSMLTVYTPYSHSLVNTARLTEGLQ